MYHRAVRMLSVFFANAPHFSKHLRFFAFYKTIAQIYNIPRTSSPKVFYIRNDTKQLTLHRIITQNRRIIHRTNAFSSFSHRRFSKNA